jgi:serine/threonine protein phosphatase PrpC
MGKANQDSYLVGESILGDKNTNIFGIFDGHGEYGDFCSYFCAESFTGNLVKELDEAGGVDALNGSKMESIYTKSFQKTNTTMNKSNIDDTLSGTTGVTLIIKGDQLIVGNVGDSRAIIASMVDGKLKYAPLSNDQTPYRKDERTRLKKLVCHTQLHPFITFITLFSLSRARAS